MIRFSAGLVIVALGVLIGGVATSKLSLVYVSIAISVAGLLAWAIGVFLKRGELGGEPFGGRSQLVPAGAGAGGESSVHERQAPADAGSTGVLHSWFDQPAPSPAPPHYEAPRHEVPLPVPPRADEPAWPTTKADWPTAKADWPTTKADWPTAKAGPSAEPGSAEREEGGTRLVTVVPGVPRYHEPDCILIRFMPPGDVKHKTISEARAANCTPCAACQPAEQ